MYFTHLTIFVEHFLGISTEKYTGDTIEMKGSNRDLEFQMLITFSQEGHRVDQVAFIGLTA